MTETINYEYVTVKLAEKITGYTEKAIRRKRESGVWLENREFVIAPDGRLLINIPGVKRWVEQAPGFRSAKLV